MEQTNLKQIEIGTIDKPKLTPEKVKIVKTEIEYVEKAKSNKVVCHVKHPKSEDEISISSVKIEQGKDKVKVVGMWVNLDKDNKLDKNSATAILLRFLGCKTIEELEGKECSTTEDDGGYLCFRGY